MNDQRLIKHYVRQGFDWIQENGTKYDLQLSRIDVATFTVNSVDHCVLAQASGQSFGDIMFTMYRDGVHNNEPGWAMAHGFMPFGDEDTIAVINQHWLHFIAQTPTGN